MHGRAEEGGAGASGREEQQRDPSAQVSAAQGGEEAAVPPPRRSAAPLQKEATVVHYCEPSRAAATTATLRASCPSAPQAAGGWVAHHLLSRAHVRRDTAARSTTIQDGCCSCSCSKTAMFLTSLLPLASLNLAYSYSNFLVLAFTFFFSSRFLS
jgi:hypothetical protein